MLLPISAASQHTADRLPVRKDTLQLVIALRALAALVILWHHFALYPPLREWAAPLAGGVLDWLQIHARATQVFFVMGGYVMACSMNGQNWSLPRLRSFIIQRYYRLGLPYLVTIALIIPIYACARDWLPEQVVGEPVSWPQLLAHLFFLQGILGYEQLSAGLWFVCINFQLCLVYAAGLWCRDALGRGRTDFIGLLGWPLALLSLFYVNLNDAWDVWWLYFFPYFFMGIVIHRSLQGGNARHEFWLYLALFVVAMAFAWRWRLLSALTIGTLLFSAEKMGWGARWPKNGAITWLGNISFSLFLMHFPVLVLVGTLWTRFGWTSPPAALAGLLFAFGLSILAAKVFHHWIERPSAQLGRNRRQRQPIRAFP